MTGESPKALVERLWAVWARTRDVEQVLALVDPDVEYHLLGASGRVLRGSEELREWFTGLAATEEQQDADAYAFEEIGDCVLVTGTLRKWTGRGFLDSQPAWLYCFDGKGRLTTMRGFESREQAELAAGHRAELKARAAG
jgi:hypothetical protein